MISVVIPSKDRCGYLKKTLPIFLKQPEVGEIVVVIDGSTDGTLKYLQEYSAKNKAVKFIDNGVNRGIPYSKNVGINAATLDYIFVGEDDVELTDGFFKTLLEHMSIIGADVMCGRNIFRFDYETATESISRTANKKGTYINKRMIEVSTSMDIGSDMLTTMAAAPVLGRAEIFKTVPFDERYKVNFWREETDFQFSLQEAGYTLGSCPHAICFNYVITDDTGGVHSSGSLKRARWILINNWIFVNKHEAFIKKHFIIWSKYTYISIFTLRMGYLFLKRILLRTGKST